MLLGAVVVVVVVVAAAVAVVVAAAAVVVEKALNKHHMAVFTLKRTDGIQNFLKHFTVKEFRKYSRLADVIIKNVVFFRFSVFMSMIIMKLIDIVADADNVCGFQIATSVCARGLDVKDLILVVNYDCPNHYEDYVHRCGSVLVTSCLF